MKSFEKCYEKYENTAPKEGQAPSLNIYNKRALLLWGHAAKGAEEWETSIRMYKKFLKERDPDRDPYEKGVFYINMAINHFKLRKIKEGNVTEAQVTIENKSDAVVPTPIAIIGIPGGLEVRHDQLKELRDKGTIASYEVVGREVVLYWRELKARTKVELPLSLVAAVPGKYTAPASEAGGSVFRARPGH